MKIKPGMTANVEIVTAEKKGALLVPNKALRFYVTGDDGQVKRYNDKGIWLKQGGKLSRVSIKTGVSDDEMTEIISDKIKVGDLVVVEDKNAAVNKSQMRMRMPR